MRIDFNKTSHILFFVVLLPGLSFGTGWLFYHLLPGIPFWIDSISPLAAYGLFFAYFERVAWHWPVFRWVGIVTVPDVRGRWLGKQQSSYRRADGNNVTSRVVLEIEQTFNNIRARTYYKRWQVDHCDGSFMELDGQLSLVLLFESEPNSNVATGEGSQKGVTRLTYLPGEDKLTGDYFNDSGNHGEVTFTHRGLKLFRRFEA